MTTSDEFPRHSDVHRLPFEVGRFQIRDELGAGGFGTVYLAFDPVLNREVALKVPHPAAVIAPGDARRFTREAKAAGGLHHPHIVPIFDTGVDGSRPYIASAFVNGKTLTSLIDQRELSLRQSVSMVIALADALAYAHGEGVIHRDVTPSNVIVDDRGQPHLTDFGLASIRGTQRLTRDGAVLGTPSYIAPELMQWQQCTVEPSADQYSLGVILYELLCYQKPFHGSLEVISYCLQHHEIPAPRSVNSEVPRDLETICLKVLSKDPDKRYSDCADLADDLRRWLAEEPIRARRVTMVERTWRWMKRNPALAGFSTTALCLMVVIATAAPMVAWRETTLREIAEQRAYEAVTARLQADSESKRAQQQELQSRRLLYTTRMNLAARAWEIADIGRVHNLLSPYLPGSRDHSLRGLEWHHLWAKSHEYVRAFDAGEAAVTDVALSPGRDQVAFATSDRRVTIIDFATGKTVLVLKTPVVKIAYSPDGTMLATATALQIRLWDLEQEREVAVFSQHRVRDLQFTHCGTRLVAVGADREFDESILIWDLKKKTATRVGDEIPGRFFCCAFGPHGEMLAIGGPKAIHLVDIELGQLRRTISVNSYWVLGVAFSPDGTKVAGLDEDIKLWDVQTGEEVVTIPAAEKNQITSIAFTPNGNSLIVASDRTVQIWDIISVQPRAEFRGHSGYVTSLAFTPDGEKLISASDDGTLKEWNLQGPASLLYSSSRLAVKSLAFSPDSRTLASGCEGTLIDLWDVASGRHQQTIQASGWWIDALEFSPEGSMIAASGKAASIQLWEFPGGSPQPALEGHQNRLGHVHDLAFSPGGDILASASRDETVRLWDTSTWENVLTLSEQNGEVLSVAYGQDGKTLVAARANRQIEVWDLESVSIRTRLRGHRGAVNSVAYLPDEQFLVSGGADQSMKLWNLATGEIVRSFEGHAAGVSAVVSSPDGTRMISASLDGTLKFWGLDSDEPKLTLRGPGRSANCLAFSPDGKTLASGYNDGSIRLWRFAIQPEGSSVGKVNATGRGR